MDREPALAKATERWRDLHEATAVTEDQIQAGDVALRRIAATSKDFRPDPGNWPKILYGSSRPAEKALILIHGLTDSPAFVEAIGTEVAAHGKGCTVLLPLLPGHGRIKPEEVMRACTYRGWRDLVDGAVAIASTLADEVSIGGFSTGGALAFDKVLRDRGLISGKVYLFSAALNLSFVDKIFLGTHVASAIEDIKVGKTGNDGLGGDPCKYSRMYNSAAHELELLISELQSAGSDPRNKKSFSAFHDLDRVFIAHSEADEVIDVDCVRPLAHRLHPSQRFIIPAREGIEHSQLVLKEDRDYEPKFADMKPPPKANPLFGGMMQRLFAFVDGH